MLGSYLSETKSVVHDLDLLAVVLLACVLVMGGIAGCQTDLDVSTQTYVCASDDDCATGYECRRNRDSVQVCMLNGTRITDADPPDVPDDSGPADAPSEDAADTDTADTDTTDTDATDTDIGVPKGLVITAMNDGTCAVLPSGNAYCWGENENGQLGRGPMNVESSDKPVAVDMPQGQTFIASPRAIDSDGGNTCAVTTTNAVYCWGTDAGRVVTLGDGNTHPPVAVPTRISALNNELPLDAQVEQIALGRWHACVLTSQGSVYCWGNNDCGQLGRTPVGDEDCASLFTRLSGSPGMDPAEIDVSALQDGEVIEQIAVGGRHTCALSSADRVICWGANQYRQLGTPESGFRVSPEPIDLGEIPFGSTIESVAAGAGTSCVVDDGGDAYCWGRNDEGQLGLDHREDQPQPVAVVGGLSFASVEAGRLAHTCGIDLDGKPYCWGNNEDRQLGLGSGFTDSSALTPRPVATEETFRLVSAGDAHTCGVTESDQVYCWGDNSLGQLGLGSSDAGPFDTPQPVVDFPSQ